jgi:nucleotide-binding universal stress UspA family protein
MKILLAIDDSKFSDAALRALLSQYNPRKNTVRVLHVVEPIETPFYPELAAPYPASLGDVSKGLQKAAKELVSRTVERVRAAGFQVGGAVRQGQARTTVVDVAKTWHADLIIVGSHGRKGLKRILLGSVSDYVARHAHCSVEIVRAPRRRKL